MASGRAEALADLARTAPDVVLMDINLPGASGVEATRRVLQLAPATAVLVISMVDDDDSVFAALAAGARGYVLKGATAAEITAALATVAAGGAVFGAGIASRMLARTPALPGGPLAGQDDLTAREREVLDLLAEGAEQPADRPCPRPVAQDGAEPRLPSWTSCRPPTGPRPRCGSPGGSAAAALSLPTGPSPGMLARVIDPDSAVPPYEQVAKMLRDEIAEGNMTGRIPSVATIAEHHQVSHRVGRPGPGP